METAQAIVTLIGAIVGALATGVPLIISLVKLFKNKSFQQNWATIMAMADAAMAEAEKSGASGADKKQIVISAVEAACKSQGIDTTAFTDQLPAYIDQCITFVNSMKTTAKKTTRTKLTEDK